jgi:stage IV sporulation protein FB
VIGFLLTIIFVGVSLFLHEMAHVLAVKFMGGKVERVGIFPMGVFAKTRRLETLHPWERYVIFAAGPVANLGVAAWGYGVSWLSYTGIGWLEGLAFYSLVLGFFNLTPVLPLDGGRLTWLFLGNRVGMLRASRFLRRLGFAVAGLYFVLGLVQIVLFPFNFTLLAAAVFVWHRNKKISPELQLAFHQAIEGKNHPSRKRLVPEKIIFLPAETPIKCALERIPGDYFAVFEIGEKKRLLHEQTLLDFVFKQGFEGTVSDVFGESPTMLLK